MGLVVAVRSEPVLGHGRPSPLAASIHAYLPSLSGGPRVLKPKVCDSEGAEQGDDGEVARLYHDARLDLPQCCDRDLGAGRELFLSQACLLAKVPQPRGQPFRLISIGAVCASSSSGPGHSISVE